MAFFVLLGLTLLISCSGKDVEDAPFWRSIGAGNAHSCAISERGGLWCWGANGSGQLGDGSLLDRSSPVKVKWASDKGFQAVAMGYAHTCAIDDDGALLCWGDDSFGQLGGGRVRFAQERKVLSVAAGYAHTCAVLEGGSLVCWGFNGSGQLGDGSFLDRRMPTPVDLGWGASVEAVTAGFSHSCALLDTGSIKCWGGNDFGQLGDGSTVSHPVPVSVNLGWSVQVQSVAAGDSHTCAVLVGGGVRCWGGNDLGQLGDGGKVEQTSPVRAVWLENRLVRTIVTGKDYTCAVEKTGSLVCWGGTLTVNWETEALAFPQEWFRWIWGRDAGFGLLWRGRGIFAHRRVMMLWFAGATTVGDSWEMEGTGRRQEGFRGEYSHP